MSSSGAVPTLPPTVPKEEKILDTVVSETYVNLSENARTELAMHTDAVKAVCSEYNTDFLQLTE